MLYSKVSMKVLQTFGTCLCDVRTYESRTRHYMIRKQSSDNSIMSNQYPAEYVHTYVRTVLLRYHTKIYSII